MINTLSNIIKSTDEDFTEAWRSVSNIDRINTMRMHSDIEENQEHILDESEDEYEQSLGGSLSRIRIRLITILEILKLPTLLAEFTQEWTKYAQKATKLEFSHQIGELYCPSLECLNSYYLIIKELTSETKDIEAYISAYEINQLTGILRATPKIIYDRKLVPKNEAEVRKSIYEVLTTIFPDTARELDLPSTIKTYKPDIGIRHLKTLIEYKFSTDENDLKQAIDGIMADIPAYSGHASWQHFFAVFYITAPFYTEDQIRSHFDKKMIQNWKFLVVQGDGKRTKKKRQKSSKNKPN